LRSQSTNVSVILAQFSMADAAFFLQFREGRIKNH
jgi:hypothetical protein